MTSRPRFAPAALTAGLALGLLAPLVAPASAQFGDTTDVVVVEVPVYVTRDGAPVTGLTAEDFVIEDNGKKQEIIGFEAVDLYGRAGAPPTEAPPIAARRHFLFLFDLSFSQPEAVVRAREAAVDVLYELHPSDLAAVAVYSPTQGASFVVGFTSDRRQAELAIGTLGAPELIERHADPLNLVVGELRPEGRVIEDADEGGRRAIFEQINDETLTSILDKISVSERANQQSRVGSFTANLEAVADGLAAVDGRKYVVFFSEGFSDELLIGTGGDTIESRRARESGEIWDVSTEEMFGSTGTQNDLQKMIGALQRADAVVQAVDIGRLRGEGVSGGLGAGKSSLFAMANDTGGELYENFNDLGAAMSQMLEKTGVTYLLAFAPEKISADGKPHRLKVAVRDQPRGTHVHHRTGYYAPRPFTERSAAEKKVTAAELVMAREDSGSVDVAVLAAPQPSGAPEYYVPVLIEIGGPSLLLGNADPVTDVELFAYAFDADGGLADYQVQVAALDLATVGEQLRTSGLKYWGHLDLEPGSYRLRVVARNLRTGEHGARTLDLVVPDFAAGLPVVSPALVPEPPTRWVLVREGTEHQRDVPFPFLVQGHPIVPQARATVARKGTTQVVLQAYNLGDAPTARLVDTAGRPVDGAVVEVAATEPAPAGGTVADATLTTRGVAPGAYRLEVTGGGATATLPVVVE